jgi:TPR repeat protein
MIALLPLALLLAQTPSVATTAEERYVAELRARIAQGDVDAEVALGNLYESGDSTLPLDMAQAAEWYRRAAEKGHAGAQVNVAMMYFEGHGVSRDVAQAIRWYEKAAGQQDAIAMFSLASIYASGAAAIARDTAKAATWYRRAADQGLITAQYQLGLSYRDGRGVPRDASQATAWLLKAADRGLADAQLELGILLRRSPTTIVESHRWLNLAASLWKDEAQRVRAARARDELEQKMTAAERREAYRLATEWQDAHAWGK